MRRLLPLLALLAGACEWVFDGETPDVVVSGTPRAPDVLVPVESGGDWQVVVGGDGAPWLVLRDGGGATCTRLVAPSRAQRIDETVVGVTPRALFTLDPAGTLDVWRPGDAAPVHAHATKDFASVIHDDDGAVYAWHTEAAMTSLEVHRLDDDTTVTIDAPGNVPWTGPEWPLWSRSGEFLFTARMDETGSARRAVFVDDTRTGRQVALGSFVGGTFAIDETHARFIACTKDGLLAATLDGSSRETLDPAPCTELVSPAEHRDEDLPFAVYVVASADGREVRSVPLDGAEPPRALLATNRQWQLLDATETQAAYTTGATLQAVDGWVGDWQFMERGDTVRFSRDGTQLRWLEHTDSLSGEGDLYVAIPGDASRLHVARNVTEYRELPDGRIVVDDDHAIEGPFNRVIIVDEARRVGTVLAHATRFAFDETTGGFALTVLGADEGEQIGWLPLPPR